MKKRLVLTTVFAMFFGCLVSFADVTPRGGNKGPEKPKTVKVDNKRDNKKPDVKPAPKPAPVCHLNHHHNDHCCKPAPKPICCNTPNHHNCNNVNGVVAGAVTTAAVIGLIAAIVD